MRAAFLPPEPVDQVLSRLTTAGFEAYLVGGCVRALLLRREPADWDICTAAHPNDVKALFPDSLETGLRHGTITVMMPQANSAEKGRFPVEVTTFRAESDYADHRHPEVIRFCSDLRTDLSRRDFTINAMAWSPATGLVDMFGGQLDLADRLVRCVGAPLLRFSEDALRMLRAIRFCSQLGFSLDPDALQAIRLHRNDLLHVSLERVQYEMTRTLTGQQPSQAVLWWETGLHVLLFDTLLPVDARDDLPLTSFSDLSLRPVLRLLDKPAGAPDGNEAPIPPAVGNPSIPTTGEPPVPTTGEPPVPTSGNPPVPTSGNPLSPTSEKPPAPAVTAWALLLLAGGLTAKPDALAGWMRRFRFPNALALDVRRLIALVGTPLPPTPRNLCLAVSQDGPAWTAAAFQLRHALAAGGINRAPEDKSPINAQMLPHPRPLPDGRLIQEWLGDGWQPRGKAFGTFLACLRIAHCEQQLLAASPMDPSVVRAMRDAAQALAASHENGPVRA
jgi:hypothetical protein